MEQLNSEIPQFNFDVEFKSPEAKNFFLNLELQEQEELSIREQIEALKRNPQALYEWAEMEKKKNRNLALIKSGLHPTV